MLFDQNRASEIFGNFEPLAMFPGNLTRIGGMYGRTFQEHRTCLLESRLFQCVVTGHRTPHTCDDIFQKFSDNNKVTNNMESLLNWQYHIETMLKTIKCPKDTLLVFGKGSDMHVHKAIPVFLENDSDYVHK